MLSTKTVTRVLRRDIRFRTALGPLKSKFLGKFVRVEVTTSRREVCFFVKETGMDFKLDGSKL